MREDYSIVWHGIAPDPWVFETSRTPDRRYQIGTSFYTSRHFCPNCGKHLSVSAEYHVHISNMGVDECAVMTVGF